MSNKELSVLEQGDVAFLEERYPEAIARYAGWLQANPADRYAWLRCGMCLQRLGDTKDAVSQLGAAGAALADHGEMLLAIVAAKELEALSKDDAAELVSTISSTYGAESTRVDGKRKPGPPPVRADKDAISVETGDDDALVEAALAACVAARSANVSDGKSPLPHHALLSDLAAEDFQEVVQLLTVRGFKDGDPVMREGEVGTSMYMVARGTVRVERDKTPLAYLRSGAFFGEMALLTRSPRHASVISEGVALLVELDRDALETLAEGNPKVAGVLASYTRSRMLANLIATSPLFEPLEPTRRAGLVELFTSAVYAPGDVIVKQGEVSEGLFVVLSGLVNVVKGEGDDGAILAQLAAGDAFGEISLIKSTPATATVRANSKSVVLCLPKDAFNAHVADYPEFLAHVFKLAVDRFESAQQTSSSFEVVSDEHVLI